MTLLKVVVAGVEAAVIGTCAATAVLIATEHGGSIADASILGAIAAVEALRVPTAMAIPRLKWSGAVVAVLLCLAITPLTVEGLLLASERLIHARTLGVAEAEENLVRAEAAYSAARSAEDRRLAAIAEARRHRAEIDKPVSLAPVPQGTCSGRARNGSRAVWDCRATLGAVAGNKAALEAHNAALRQADAATMAAEAVPATNLVPAQADLAEARRRLAVEKSESVMHRAAAARFGVDPANLGEDQFAKAKRVAMLALSVTIASATMLAGFVSSLPRWDGRPSRLSRAFRGLLLASRRRLRRIDETVRVERHEHVKFVYFDKITLPVARRSDNFCP
jgi:hypothetical protein